MEIRGPAPANKTQGASHTSAYAVEGRLGDKSFGKEKADLKETQEGQSSKPACQMKTTAKLNIWESREVQVKTSYNYTLTSTVRFKTLTTPNADTGSGQQDVTLVHF